MIGKYFVLLLINLLVFYPCFGSLSHAAINDTKVTAPNSNVGLNSPVQEVSEAQKSQIQEAYGKLPLYFTKNDGQVDKRVKFYEKGSGHSTFFTKKGVYMSFVGQAPRQAEPAAKVGWAAPTVGKSAVQSANLKSTNPTPQSETIKLIPLNANKSPEITAETLQEGKVNYFIGNDSKKWKTNIATYKAVVYKELYKDIDMKFYGNNSQLEYDIVVKPGADPSKVKLSYEGIKGLKVTENGELEISLKEGKLLQKKPYVYQEIDGKKIEIEGKFKIFKPQASYGFQVASYDKSRPLIIDPVLVYSTYFGGGNQDWCTGIALDTDGNIYVTGTTGSSDFPSVNAIQPVFAGPTGWRFYDVFVAKLNPNGSALVYSTYIGGVGIDVSHGIAVDADGNAYITGETWTYTFPTVNALQPKRRADGGAAFITKLNSTGSALIFSTYFSGIDTTRGYAIAVDSYGNSYITGMTYYRGFPIGNAVQPAYGGGWQDAFITKINSTGSAIIYSTFLGGNGDDYGFGIAVDDAGNAYVTGVTLSTNFPTANPLQPEFGGPYYSSWTGSDAFVTKINSTGSSIIYSTYLGGSGDDYAYGIAVDSAGNAYVTGATNSTNFPIKGAFQSVLSAGWDAFVTKLNADGSSFVYSTYLGGSGNEGIGGGNWASGYYWAIPFCNIVVDSAGNAYVTGRTGSADFPTIDPLQSTFGGSWDVYVAKFSITGHELIYSTFLGGNGDEWGSGIAVDTLGNAYVAGTATSSSFPITVNALQTYKGGWDGFVFKISDTVAVPSALTASDIPCDNGGSITLSWTLSPDDGSKVTGYQVYRSTTSGGPYDLIGSVSAGANNYTDATATTGVTAYYVVRATDGTNESANSNEALAASVRNLPLPPSGVTATDAPYDLGGSISLSWAKSTDDGTGLNNVLSYNIYRYSSTNGNIVSLASTQAGTVSYVDATTADTDTYYYFLKTMDKNCGIESSASSIASGQSVNNLTSLPGFISTLPGIAPELVNSLTSKVENAIASFDRGNETAAINQLNALLSEIAAQAGKKTEASTAEILTNYVQNLINYVKTN